jgi:hypothetical protein
MAGPTVTLAFAGDATSLDKAFADVGASADKMAKDVGGASDKIKKDTGAAFDGVRDSADNTERRIIGFRDSLTGTKDVAKGLATGDMELLATGFADLASSVANLGADMLAWGKKALQGGASAVKAHGMAAAATVKNTASMVAHKAASIASTAATHTMAAAQWVLNAAMSANPIMLVVLGLGALVAAFVVAWQHSETFREIVTGAFDKVKEIAEGAFNWVRDNWPLLLGILTGPIGLAVLAITKNWDSIKEGFTSVKDWIGNRIDDIVSFFTGLPGRITTAATGAFTGLYNSFAGTLNSIIRAWNDFELGFSWGGKDMPGPIPDVPGFSMSIPTPNMPYIPMLANGGIATGATLAMIGEGGRDEAVLPLPHNWRNGGFGGGDTFVVQISGNVYSDIDFERKLEAGVARLRSNGGRF